MAQIKNLNYYFNMITVEGFKELVEEVVKPGLFKTINVDDVVYDETVKGGVVKVYYHIGSVMHDQGQQVVEWNSSTLGNLLVDLYVRKLAEDMDFTNWSYSFVDNNRDTIELSTRISGHRFKTTIELGDWKRTVLWDYMDHSKKPIVKRRVHNVPSKNKR